jgi:hypothetical protein
VSSSTIEGDLTTRIDLVVLEGRDCAHRYGGIDNPRNPEGLQQDLPPRHPEELIHQRVLDLGVGGQEAVGPLIGVSSLGTIFGGVSLGFLPQVLTDEDDREAHNVRGLAV